MLVVEQRRVELLASALRMRRSDSSRDYSDHSVDDRVVGLSTILPPIPKVAAREIPGRFACFTTQRQRITSQVLFILATYWPLGYRYRLKFHIHLISAPLVNRQSVMRAVATGLRLSCLSRFNH